MKTEICKITKIQKKSPFIITLGFRSNYLSKNLLPGQFLNIKIDDEKKFILRRPFSVSDVSMDEVTILFNIVGKGTFTLSEKKVGDKIDVLGPLGNGFDITADFKKAVILGGGIGVAPFPLLVKKLKEKGKEVFSFFGYRTKSDVIDFGFENTFLSTDDGSMGYHGNVNQHFLSRINEFDKEITKIFACGPNVMLKNLSERLFESGFNIEVSIESYMACGIGICQGCPVESFNEPQKYHLVCKDGPCFNIKDIRL